MAWKKIPHQTVDVHLLNNGGEQNSESYRLMNPAAQVPYLEIVDEVAPKQDGLAQSLPICLYLEESFPNPPLLPSQDQLLARHQVLSFCEWINSGIQPFQNLSHLNSLKDIFEITDDGKKAYLFKIFQKGLEVIETQIQNHTGPFCFGAKPTLADCFLIPQLYSCRRQGFDLSPFAKTLAVESNVLDLPELKIAHPEDHPLLTI